MDKSLLDAQIVAYCEQKGYPAPVHGDARAELKFHPTRKWRWDYAFVKPKIAVEVHGSTWAAGRHTRGGGFAADREKMVEGQLLGWLVIECTYQQIESGQLWDWLDRAMGLRTKSKGGRK